VRISLRNVAAGLQVAAQGIGRSLAG